MIENKINIKTLFDDLSNTYEIHKKNDYEVIYPNGLEIKVYGNKYVKLIAVSRHKTSKNIINVEIKSTSSINNLNVTTDHVCMICNRDKFFDNVNAKNLKIGDYVSIYDEIKDSEVLGEIINIKDLGKTDDYVYDCEVNDDNHSFYANNVNIHNSQFVNIACVTDKFKEKYSLDTNLAKWQDDDKLKLWKWMDTFVEEKVNAFVQDLIKTEYGTEHPEVLRYSLEYIAACGIYEAKKHYGVHKILSEGPEIVDSMKFSGIELKKASTSATIKEFLKDIYVGVLKHEWVEQDFIKYINESYDKFRTLGVNDIAMWKGYNTAREASGFLQMELGATGISKAVTFYNQMIDHLKIGKKYDSILLGQKVRFTYIIPSNEYGIECMAFHDGQWPKEFDEIFKVDYEVMFDKLIISPLKGFMEATKFRSVDPRKQVVFDIFDL